MPCAVRTRAKPSWRKAVRFGVGGMDLDERLRPVRAERGLRPVRVMVCHWSRIAAGVETQREFLARPAPRSAGGSRRDEPRLAVGGEETAVGEEPRRAAPPFAGTGHCTGSSAS